MLLLYLGLLVFLLTFLHADAMDECDLKEVPMSQHLTGKSVGGQPPYKVTATITCSSSQHEFLIDLVGGINRVKSIDPGFIWHSHVSPHPVCPPYCCPVAPLPKTKQSTSTALPILNTSSTLPSTSSTRNTAPHIPYLPRSSRPLSTRPSHCSPPRCASLPRLIDPPHPLYPPCLPTPPKSLSPPPFSLTSLLFDCTLREIATATKGGWGVGVSWLWVEHLGHAIGLEILRHLRPEFAPLASTASHRNTYTLLIYIRPIRFPCLAVSVTFHHGGIPLTTVTTGGSGYGLWLEPSGKSDGTMADPLLESVGMTLMLDGSFEAEPGSSPVVSAPPKASPSEKLSLAMVLLVFKGVALLASLLALNCIILGDYSLVLPAIVVFVDAPWSTTNEILLLPTLLAAPMFTLTTEIVADRIAANPEMAFQNSGQWLLDVSSSTGISTDLSNVHIRFIGARNPYKVVASSISKGVPFRATLKKRRDSPSRRAHDVPYYIGTRPTTYSSLHIQANGASPVRPGRERNRPLETTAELHLPFQLSFHQMQFLLML